MLSQEIYLFQKVRQMIKKEFLLFFMFHYNVYSQGEDINSVFYEREYYNNSNIVSTSNDNVELNLIFDKNLSLKSTFSHLLIDFTETQIAQNNENIQHQYLFDVGVAKKIKLGRQWNTELFFGPQIRSDLKNKLTSNNFFLNGRLLFEMINSSKKSSLKFGIEHGTLLGSPSFYPIFKYQYFVNSKLNFSIGFPETNILYNLNKKHSLKVLGEYDTYFTRFSNEIISQTMVNEIRYYESIFISKIKTSFTYNYHFYNGSVFHLSIGKSFDNNLKIKESNAESNFHYNNDVMISMGFKYNLNLKK